MPTLDYASAAKARGLRPTLVATWIERGIVKSADDQHVDTEELDDVIRTRVSDPEVLALVPEKPSE